jgi:predicted GNAT family N-acyltransferase
MRLMECGIVRSAMTASVRIRWARGTGDIADALAIRERVFCEEQGVSLEEEHDGLDASSFHLLAFATDDDRAIATLRVHITDELARIGRLAVERSWRRRGIATEMLAAALERAREEGCSRARLAAQLGAQPLYARAGFRVESAPFFEAGIEHVWMARELSDE